MPFDALPKDITTTWWKDNASDGTPSLHSPTITGSSGSSSPKSTTSSMSAATEFASWPSLSLSSDSCSSSSSSGAGSPPTSGPSVWGNINSLGLPANYNPLVPPPSLPESSTYSPWGISSKSSLAFDHFDGGYGGLAQEIERLLGSDGPQTPQQTIVSVM